MAKAKEQFGYCGDCGYLWPVSNPEQAICRVCGERLEKIKKVTEVEKSDAYFQDWVMNLRANNLWGPSPQQAAKILGCGRANVDHLVRSGVLRRSEYDRDGHKIVVISWESIQKAKENKVRSERLTGKLRGRPGLA